MVFFSVNKATEGLDMSKSDAMTGGYYTSMKPGSGKEKRTLQSVKTHFYVGSEVDSNNTFKIYSLLSSGDCMAIIYFCKLLIERKRLITQFIDWYNSFSSSILKEISSTPLKVLSGYVFLTKVRLDGTNLNYSVS